MKKLLILALSLHCTILVAQPYFATFEVTNPSDFHTPVKVNLDEITSLYDSTLRLIETTGGKKIPVAFQIENGGSRELIWIVPPSGNKKLTFALTTSSESVRSKVEMSTEKNDGDLIIKHNEKNFFSTILKRCIHLQESATTINAALSSIRYGHPTEMY